jgi:opacity protein-like surface antigen
MSSNTEFEPAFRKSLSFGLRAGATTSDLNEGAMDAGLGLAIGYRLFEPLGVELSYIDYGDRIDLAADSPFQASAQLFLFPWQELNPYVSGGVTVSKVAEAKNETGIKSAPDGYGYSPQTRLGVQFGGTDNVAVTVEARYNSFSNIEKEGSIQGILGVDYYF